MKRYVALLWSLVIVAGTTGVWAFLLAPAPAAAQGADARVLSAEERREISHAIEGHVRDHFAHWSGVPELDFEAVAAAYRTEALNHADRQAFGRATLAFLTHLQNGHTGYWDRWLQEEHGQPLGMYARPLSDGWVVLNSRHPDIPRGSILRAIDGEPFESFAAAASNYIPASNRRSALLRLFHRPYLFPEQFVLALGDGRAVEVNRRMQELAPLSEPARTAGRWLVEGQVAYIRIPSFAQPHFEERARELLAEFRSAPALVIDVRGNGGGATPWRLTHRLMDRRYRWWRTEEETLRSSAVLRVAERAALTLYRPRRYRGDLYLLVDGNCSSACEDFAVPFKDNGRALLIGEPTEGSSGQPVFLRFENGMGVRTGARRHVFPDGSPFEGVGIFPDTVIALTSSDVRGGHDPVLEYALTEATARLRN